ncbi:RagB/SusD family nutrient uptake outer membrane protein [Niabella ginsengisoli]|uniref:RagB/SusD family nutrient uptake outer membrane protein n=1 Tax=Niabella ginsengisoli TaxID=522298 RepID=A0ABS9SJ61_9BACT|nr:RagB/SusD family nutrient uptake outer membrane protein [Niabella ginsengisoli]MCH5598408.1 RagB/SusD family nutrient uptake outer membrane protein [Niabella ginsengisoli]
MSYFMVFSDEFFIKGATSGINGNLFDASSLEIGRQWEALYTGVERANMLLDHIDNAIGSVSQEKINEVRGQALFMRAYYHFLLADQYGPIPLKLSSAKTPEEDPLPRSPLAEVYTQIVKDMKDAIPLLRKASEYGFNGKVSTTAAQGILTRVFLSMAGSPLKDEARYADAALYADSVMQSGEHSLNPDFKQIYINHVREVYDIKECLWEVEFGGNNQGTIREGGSIGSYNGIYCTNIDTGWGADLVHATAKLYNAYEAQDLRRDWSIAPFRFVASGNTVVRTNWSANEIYERNNGKWRREYENLLPRNKDFNGTNWPLLRYADVLLMFAEADNYINNGPTARAYEALNQVRRRGYGKPVSAADPVVDAPAGMPQADFQEFIMNERLRELAFEGLRKHDLIRWGIYISTMQQQAATYDATMPTALKAAATGQARRITSRSVVFPIPHSELNVNHNATQNPGW